MLFDRLCLSLFHILYLTFHECLVPHREGDEILYIMSMRERSLTIPQKERIVHVEELYSLPQREKGSCNHPGPHGL